MQITENTRLFLFILCEISGLLGALIGYLLSRYVARKEYNVALQMKKEFDEEWARLEQSKTEPTPKPDIADIAKDNNILFTMMQVTMRNLKNTDLSPEQQVVAGQQIVDYYNRHHIDEENTDNANAERDA